MNFIATGIGAGLVSALLTVVVIKATTLAAVLYLLAPIPVLIVSLGWNHRSGLVATLVGGLAVGILLTPVNGLTFAIATALPAWWWAYLALLGRSGPDGIMEWYPVGRLVTWVAITAAVSLVLVLALVVTGDFEALHQILQRSARQTLDFFEALQLQNGGSPTPEANLQEQAVQIADWLPFVASTLYTLVSIAYLYLAARIVHASGRLARPWPDVPRFVIPLGVGILVIAAWVGIFILAPASLIGFLNSSIAGALTMAFALQGLAVIHERTRGKSGRGFLLAGLYVLLFMTQGIMVLALSLLGLTDTLFGLRRRVSGNRPNPPSTLST